MGLVNIIRYIVFGKVFLISIATLGLCANLLSQFSTGDTTIPTYLGLDLAVAVITIVLIIPSVVIDFFRKGAFTSMVAVEIGWISLLMILWVAGAGDTTAAVAGLNCDIVVDEFDGFDDFQTVNDDKANSDCRQAYAIMALAWISWIATLGWLVNIITLSAITHSRGNSKVWTSSVTAVAWGARNTNNTPTWSKGYQTPNTYNKTSNMMQNYTGYPPQQQQQQGYQFQQQGYNANPYQANPYGGAAQV